MWLADISDSSEDVSNKGKEARQNFRSSSPPLEGGESLCEFYVEYSGQKESDSGDAESVCDGVKDSSKQLQADVVSPDADDRLPNKNLFSLLSQELLPVNTFTQTFLQSILSSVDSHDPVVANAWVETLLDVIDLLPKEIIKNEILTLAVNKGQMSQPVSSRLLCCRMLGKLCTKFDPYVIKKEVLPVVLSLCQDLDYEVRGCMCRQLDIVARGIGLEAAKSAILPGLVELSNDKESFVRLAGIETVVQMLPILDDETCTQAIIPLVQKFCENAILAEDSTLPVVAKQLGQLCHGLAINLTTDQKLWFLKFFRDLAKLGLPYSKNVGEQGVFSPMPDLVPELENRDRLTECRYACAYNFPAMVLFAEPCHFHTELHETFSALCSDPFLNVKKTISCGFYEVIKLLNLQSPLILPELICLLNDNSLEVLKGIIPHLPEILKIIYQRECQLGETKEIHTKELVQAIISCEVTTSISSNWRLHAELLTQISTLPQCLSPDIIYKHFVPLLLVKLYSARPIPCRTASAYSLLVLLRHTPKLEQRNGIIEELIKDLCFGRSCHKRMLFIKMCDLVLELFSKAFFKRHFFRPVLNLCEDRVPNIRLRMCAILPKLKGLMKLPKDGALLQQLESCVRKLMTEEKDRDVAAAVTKAIEELDKIEVPTEPVSRRWSVDVETNLEDLHKEAEENRLISMEFGLDSFCQAHLCPSTPSKGLARHGKIPVRKSGTLPKPSKSKEFKSNTLTRGTSNKVSKFYEHENISSPVSPLKFQNGSKQEAVNKRPASSPVQKKLPSPTKCIRPKSPVIHRLPFYQDQQQIGSKKLINRCPSPMPPPRQIIDNRVLLQFARLSAQENSRGPNPNLKHATDDDLTLQNASADAGRNYVDRSKSGTPVPSPEIPRRQPMTSSKIPMPSSK